MLSFMIGRFKLPGLRNCPLLIILTDLNKLYKKNYSFAKLRLKKRGCNRFIFDEIYQGAFHILVEKQRHGVMDDIHSKWYIVQLCQRLWFLERKRMAVYDFLDGTEEFEYEENDTNTDTDIKMLLMKHLNKLSKICREILTLYSLGYSEKKIIKNLNLIDRNVVKNKKYYCKEKLRMMIISDPLFDDIYE